MAATSVAMLVTFLLTDASAGLIKYATKQAAAGAAEELEPAIARTLADVDRRLATHEVRIGNIAGQLLGQTSAEVGQRLTQVDGILENRLLQVQLGATDILAFGLDKIDRVAEGRLAQIDSALARRIGQVAKTANETLDRVDRLLAERTADLGRTVVTAVERADGALQARMEQLDEIAGRRLANVDVIATKQRLGLERTIVRAAWLVGVVVFIIVVLVRLWKAYVEQASQIAQIPVGWQRTKAYVYRLGKPLLRNALVAGVVALALWQMPDRLPMAAKHEERAVVERHARDLEDSYRRQDWTRVRFHASQLELLDPENAASLRAMTAKADLLEDVIERPTILMSPQGVAATLAKADDIERLLERQLDPDVLVVRALVIWQTGATRTNEHEAASLCARALRLRPRGFLLTGLARAMVEAYLHAPEPSGTPELDSAAALRATLALAADAEAAGPFSDAVVLFRLMRALEAASTKAYLTMVREQAEVVSLGLKGPASAKALDEARSRRNAAAEDVLAAWEAFDSALRANPRFAFSPVVLNVLRLNDVPLVHAQWFRAQPETLRSPKRLAELGKDENATRLKLRLLPARVTWARRYGQLLEGPARELIELQEVHRFRQMEDDTVAFEEAWTEALQGPAGPRPGARRQAAGDVVKTVTRNHLDAARAAAQLGLYEQSDDGKERRPLALRIAEDLAKLTIRLRGELEATRGNVQGALGSTDETLRSNLREARQAVLEALEKQLLARTTRLI